MNTLSASSRTIPLVVLALIAFGAPRLSQAQEASRTRFLHWAYQDVAAITTDIGSADKLYIFGTATLISATSVFDKYIGHEVPEGYRGAFATYVDITNELGGPNVTAPVIGIFAFSLFTGNERFQDAAFTSMQALVYSGALNQSVKFIVGRVRPEDASEQYHFKPFTGHSSFPSGHVNAVFAILTPWAMYYSHPVSYVLLSVAAGGTAMARIAHEKHWFTDVAAGGVQGFFTGYWLTKRHQGKQAGASADMQVSIVPSIGPDAVMLTLHVTF